MRKYFALFAAAATVLVAAASCAKENLSAAAEDEQMVEMTVIASEKPEANAAEATRTYLDGTSVKWSASGEYLHVVEVATPSEGDPITNHKQSGEGSTTDSGATMSFGVSFSQPATAASFDYYGFYPNSALNTFSSVSNVAFNTPSNQTPTATSFDPSADLLIAKKVEAGSSRPASISMQFARMVAIGKMTVKNLGTTDAIERITFTAKNGEDAVTLAGRTPFDLTTALPTSTYGPNVKLKSIILDYSGQGITANGATGMIAYFISYPFSLAAGDSFKVEVETATQVFVKEVNLAGARNLVLKEGKSSAFAVDMDGIVGETKGVDLPYAFLDFADYSSTDGANAKSYSITTTTKVHGDKWEAYAMESGSSISLRNAGSANDSYIKLPNFSSNIRTVKVTLSSVTAGKTMTLENTATSKTGTVASVSTTDELVYTFDLTSSSVKTAYLRSVNFNGLVTKIEVWAGTDTRAELTAPASVTASLNEDIPNYINVQWAPVNYATSYVITLHPAAGDDIVIDGVEGTSYMVTNLLYNTTYDVKVHACGDIYVVNPNVSGDTNAASSVTTGSEPVGDPISVTYTVTDKTSASTTGTAPEGSSVEYSQTYGTAKQMTSGNSITMTISGYDGKIITGASVKVRSNKSGGGGSLNLSLGQTSIASISDSGFDTSNWHGGWSEEYVPVALTVTSTKVKSGEKIVLTIAATKNSLYFESLTLQYR